MTQRTGIHVNKLVMNQSVYHQLIVKTDNKTRVFYHNLTYMKLQYTFSEYRIGMISFVNIYFLEKVNSTTSPEP